MIYATCTSPGTPVSEYPSSRPEFSIQSSKIVYFTKNEFVRRRSCVAAWRPDEATEQSDDTMTCWKGGL